MTLTLVACIAAGCIESNEGVRDLPRDGAELPILRQVQRTHSHETRPMQLVIRDSAAFAKVPLEDITVDFDHEMLLVITLGSVPSDQYRVRINRIHRAGGVLKVDATIVEPPEGAPIIPASPYCMAVVPACELNVERFSPDPPARHRTWTQSEPQWGP